MLNLTPKINTPIIRFMPTIGERVRIKSHHSVYFNETGIIIGEVRWGAMTLARVRLDSDGGMTERKFCELEVFDNSEPTLIL
jgi:hypothetical protein